MDEKMSTYGFALYPSTKDRMDDYKQENKVTWDELFNKLLDTRSNQKEEIKSEKETV